MEVDKKKLFEVLIPVFCAIAVVIIFAVSGQVSGRIDSRVAENTKKTDEQSQAATVPQRSSVKFVAVGDNLIGDTLIKSGEMEDGTRDYSSFYENIKPYIEKADIASVNEETVLGGESFDYSGYPDYNTPWEVGDALVNTGFDVFTCATDHAMDMGTAGIEKELDFFSKYPDVVHTGIYSNKEDYDKITYYEKNDIKFAFLNYTYGTNGNSVPEDKQYILNMLDEQKVKNDVAQARKNADVVIVFPHWGTENSRDINELQQKYVKLFSDLGVDIVIGTHPHVLQPVQWVENQNTKKKMLVYYSIGNFVSTQENIDDLCGGMAEITIEKNAGTVSITRAKLVPLIDFYTDPDSDDGFKFSVYRIQDYTDEIAKNHAQDGATKDYFDKLAKETVSDEFLESD